MAHSLRPRAPRLNWRHPLAQGLAFLALPGVEAPFDLVGGSIGTLLSNSQWGAQTRHGPALKTTHTTNAGAHWPFPRLLLGMGLGFTIAVRASPLNMAAWGNLLIVPFSSTWSDPAPAIMLRRRSTTTQADLGFSDGIERGAISDTGFIQTSDGMTTYGATRLGADVIFYRNGAQHGAAKTIVGGTPSFVNARPVNMFNRNNTATGDGMEAEGAAAAIWTRALLPGEMTAFHQECLAGFPSLIERQTPRIYIFGDELSLTSIVIAPLLIIYPNAAVLMVTVMSLAGTPTGTVDLTVNGGTPITEPLVDGIATFDLGVLSAGFYSLHAAYSGDDDFATSETTQTLSVILPLQRLPGAAYIGPAAYPFRRRQ